jgi:hypothetical protein
MDGDDVVALLYQVCTHRHTKMEGTSNYPGCSGILFEVAEKLTYLTSTWYGTYIRYLGARVGSGNVRISGYEIT